MFQVPGCADLWPSIMVTSHRICVLQSQETPWFHVFRFFSPHCDSETILMLYKSQVLPMLDDACVVRDKRDKLLLESLLNTLHLKLL